MPGPSWPQKLLKGTDFPLLGICGLLYLIQIEFFYLMLSKCFQTHFFDLSGWLPGTLALQGSRGAAKGKLLRGLFPELCG